MVERLTKKRFGDDVDIVGDLTLGKSPTIDTHAANKLYVDTQIAIIPEATNEPMGFAVRSDSTISFNTSSRIFTIEPSSTSFDVWCTGQKYVKSSAENVTIPTTSGLYYITYDSNAALQYGTTYFDLETQTPVAYVYWNNDDSTAYFFADERHGIVLDWQTHEYLHRTRGAAYGNGLNIGAYVTDGDGTSNTHMQFDISNGTFFDEDIEVSITHSATPTVDTWEQILQSGAEIPVFYKSGSLWKHTTPTKYALKQGTLPQYNLNTAGTWSTVDLTTNTYGLSWIVATNNLNYPVIAIMGQDEYPNLNKVHEDDWVDLDLTGLPIYELRPLYKVAYLVNSAYTNTPKAAIREVIDIRRYDSLISGIPATPVSDHGGLLGLSDDDHTQYVHISSNRTITATHTFTNGLISNANVTTAGLVVDSIEIDTTGAANGQSLVFNGTKFAPSTISGGATVSNTAPSSPSAGDLWLDSTDASTYVYYDSSWVGVGPAIPDQIGELIEAKGDLIVANTASTATRLAVGTNGYYLRANSSTSTGLEWGALVDVSSTIDAKGDLLVGVSDNTAGRLAVGTNGYYLKANSSTSTGLEWAQVNVPSEYISFEEIYSNYTVEAGWNNKLVKLSQFSDSTVTVPSDSTSITVGTQINFIQNSAVVTTFSPAGGVTLYSKNTARKLASQYAVATLVKAAANTWYLFGDITV